MGFKKLLLRLISLIFSAQFVPACAMTPEHDLFTTGSSAIISLPGPLRFAIENADLVTVQRIMATAGLNLAQLEFVITYAQEILEQYLFIVLETQPAEIQAEIVELGVKYTHGLLTVSQEHRLTSLLNSIASTPDLAAELTIELTSINPVAVLRSSLNVLKFLQNLQKIIMARDATAA